MEDSECNLMTHVTAGDNYTIGGNFLAGADHESFFLKQRRENIKSLLDLSASNYRKINHDRVIVS